MKKLMSMFLNGVVSSYMDNYSFDVPEITLRCDLMVMKGIRKLCIFCNDDVTLDLVNSFMKRISLGLLVLQIVCSRREAV